MLTDTTLAEFIAARGTAPKRFAYMLCGGDSHEADELVQEALVRVLSSYRRAPIDNLERMSSGPSSTVTFRPSEGNVFSARLTSYGVRNKSTSRPLSLHGKTCSPRSEV